MRKKRGIYFSDWEYDKVKHYAKARGRGISDFVRFATLSEISRHRIRGHNGIENQTPAPSRVSERGIKEVRV